MVSRGGRYAVPKEKTMKAVKGKRIAAAVVDSALLFVGLVAALAVRGAGKEFGDYYRWSVEVLTIVELCFFGLFLLIEVISAFKISDSTYHTVLLSFSLLVFHLTNPDFVRFLFGEQSAALLAADILHFLFFELSVLAVFHFWNYTYKIDCSARLMWIAGGFALLCFAAYIPLCFFDAEIAAVILFLLGIAAALVLLYRRFPWGQANANFYATEALFYSLVGCVVTCGICDALDFVPYGVASFQELPVIVVFLAIYSAFAMRTDRAALQASEYKLRYEQVKTRALKEQIKPHFIFNVLAAIQSLYRVSLDGGDRAVALLSKHLRTNIEAADTDFIPFEKELDNVQVLVDLENMRLEKKVNVVYDVDCTDFEVPILSLQPYVENAVKYSRVNEKEDGYIRISTRRTEEGVLLSVSDNGVGFDPNAVSPSSCGIRNASERFSMLMGVAPAIESAPGKGVTVSVLIKDRPSPSGEEKQKGRKKHENHHR